MCAPIAGTIAASPLRNTSTSWWTRARGTSSTPSSGPPIRCTSRTTSNASRPRSIRRGRSRRAAPALAEPGAVVGFAGPRVIKQTIGQDLPEGFQTAEFLLEHGMVDAVVARSELRDTTGQLLRHMAGRAPAEAAD